MTITVKSCGDCPFCYITWYTELRKCDMMKEIVEEAYSSDTTHPSCPLRTEKITVELENSVTLQQQPEIGPNCD